MKKILTLSALTSKDLVNKIYKEFYAEHDIKFYSMKFSRLPFDDIHQVDIEWEVDKEVHDYWKVMFKGNSNELYASFIKVHQSYNNDIEKIVDALNENLFVTSIGQSDKYPKPTLWVTEGSDYCNSTKECWKADYVIKPVQ